MNESSDNIGNDWIYDEKIDCYKYSRWELQKLFY